MMKQKTLLATFIVALIGLNNANAFSLFGMEIKSQAELAKEQQEKAQQKIMELKAKELQEQANREAREALEKQYQNQQAQTPQNNQAISQQASNTRGLGDIIGGGNIGNIVDGALNGNLNGALGGVLDSVLGKLDSQFSNIFSNSLNFINACYETDLKLDIDLGIDTTDVCAMASKLDEIKVNICSLVGGSGTMNKGVSGFQSLCEAKQKEFKDYVSRQANNFAEWATLQNGEKTTDYNAKFASGLSVADFDSKWDINNLLKKDSTISKMLKDGKMKEIEMFMDYTKSYGAKKDIESINMEDIKAPSSMNDYRRGIDDGIKNNRTIIKNANPSQSASLARAKLSKNNKEDMQKLSNQLKSDYNNAKIAEIGNALATSDYKKIAIPTQDYVKLLRKDLQPGAIAQIRRQQAQEVSLISQIEEKWERKYNLAKLLIDKEVILSQKFDETEARKEVNRIVNSN
ncbi:hypothetical protein HCCG_02067 [Helicobacter cinaedi CCUG 18818 = ATCC BAA-847]|uniref:Cag pathogenicity island protein n=2 Tax=Helicobacter cinaedi CCUG 18818 = ATCC BAA-847 TaxID=537971 RepID=A0ABN0BD03_9HELI|nr:hypothetical protein HCCG_02067 [Helicobacter cinaedi CCUG 18818 = ATCC BAA-847]